MGKSQHSKSFLDEVNLFSEMTIVVVPDHDVESIDDVLLLNAKATFLGVEGVNISKQDDGVSHVVQFGPSCLVSSESDELVDVGNVLDQRRIRSLCTQTVIDTHQRLNDRLLQNFSIVRICDMKHTLNRKQNYVHDPPQISRANFSAL